MLPSFYTLGPSHCSNAVLHPALLQWCYVVAHRQPYYYIVDTIYSTDHKTDVKGDLLCQNWHYQINKPLPKLQHHINILWTRRPNTFYSTDISFMFNQRKITPATNIFSFKKGIKHKCNIKKVSNVIKDVNWGKASSSQSGCSWESTNRLPLLSRDST